MSTTYPSYPSKPHCLEMSPISPNKNRVASPYSFQSLFRSQQDKGQAGMVVSSRIPTTDTQSLCTLLIRLYFFAAPESPYSLSSSQTCCRESWQTCLWTACRGVIVYPCYFAASSSPGSADVHLCVTIGQPLVGVFRRHNGSSPSAIPFRRPWELIDTDWMFSPP